VPLPTYPDLAPHYDMSPYDLGRYGVPLGKTFQAGEVLTVPSPVSLALYVHGLAGGDGEFYGSKSLLGVPLDPGNAYPLGADPLGVGDLSGWELMKDWSVERSNFDLGSPPTADDPLIGDGEVSPYLVHYHGPGAAKAGWELDAPPPAITPCMFSDDGAFDQTPSVPYSYFNFRWGGNATANGRNCPYPGQGMTTFTAQSSPDARYGLYNFTYGSVYLKRFGPYAYATLTVAVLPYLTPLGIIRTRAATAAATAATAATALGVPPTAITGSSPSWAVTSYGYDRSFGIPVGTRFATVSVTLTIPGEDDSEVYFGPFVTILGIRQPGPVSFNGHMVSDDKDYVAAYPYTPPNFGGPRSISILSQSAVAQRVRYPLGPEQYRLDFDVAPIAGHYVYYVFPSSAWPDAIDQVSDPSDPAADPVPFPRSWGLVPPFLLTFTVTVLPFPTSGGGGKAPPGPTLTPALLGRPSVHYNRAAADESGVHFLRSARPVPMLRSLGFGLGAGAWDAGPITIGAAGDTQPALAQDHRGLLYCLFSRPGVGAILSRSDADGEAWLPAVLAIPGGDHPAIVAAGGRVLTAAAVKAGAAPSTAMHLMGSLRGPGDAQFGPPFTFTDRAGSPLIVADDSFGLAFADEGPGRVFLHVLMAGEGATSLWAATDPARGWERLAPVVLPGAAHPGLASADGRVLAGGVLSVGTMTSPAFHAVGCYRAAGDPQFGLAFAFTSAPDLLGGVGPPLPVADDSFGLGWAAEGPDRMVLHVLIAGEKATSDWWSGDDGRTWTRIPLS